MSAPLTEDDFERGLRRVFDTKAIALSLLEEWLQWWSENPDAPVKMPDGLHVRTALLLVENGRTNGPAPLIEVPK